MFLKKEQRKTINVYKIQHLVNTAQRMICLSGGPSSLSGSCIRYTFKLLFLSTG